MMKLAPLTILLLACASINAQVYSYVDSNGNTIYTDNPPENQETRKLDIQLIRPVQASQTTQTEQQQTQANSEEETKTIRLSPDANSQPLPSESLNTAAASMNSSTDSVVVVGDQKVEIIKPTNEETLRNSGGQMTIEVKAEPALDSQQLYRFLIDGESIGETTSNTYNASNLERGEHKLIVEIINAGDKTTVARSKELVFFIKQTTLAEKRRIKPCLIREYGIRPECPLKDKPKPQPRNLLLRTTDILGLTKAPATIK